MVNSFGTLVSLIGLIVLDGFSYSSSLNSSTSVCSYCLVLLIVGVILSLASIFISIFLTCKVNGKLSNNQLHKIKTEIVSELL